MIKIPSFVGLKCVFSSFCVTINATYIQKLFLKITEYGWKLFKHDTMTWSVLNKMNRLINCCFLFLSKLILEHLILEHHLIPRSTENILDSFRKSPLSVKGCKIWPTVCAYCLSAGIGSLSCHYRRNKGTRVSQSCPKI